MPPFRASAPFSRRLGLLATGAVAAALVVPAPAAEAVTTYSLVSLAATVSGTSVQATTTVKAASTTSAQSFGVCVRDSAGADRDYPGRAATITRTGTTWSGNQVLKPGTYTYFACLQVAGRWYSAGTSKSFTVAGAAATPTQASPTPARPSPTVVPTVSPSPTPPPTVTPSPTVAPTPARPSPTAAPTVSPSPTVAPTTSTPSSAPVPTPTPTSGRWSQSYSQTFDTPAALGQVGAVYGGSMRGYSGFKDTSGKGTYAPDKVLSVSGGVLDYHLHSEGGVPLVAAPVLDDWNGQTYGRYSVRLRHDDLPGYKIAFLLWPSSDQWNDGEIDWPEGDLSRGTRMSPASAVKGSYAASTGTMTFDPPSRVYAPTDASGWHTATTEWTPGLVRFLWDDVEVGRTTLPSGVPTSAFRWTLQAETSISGPAPAATVAGHLQIDSVTSWKYLG
ncbi:Glycosyl hydrolases family 16 [Friedmanniella luteola]|uniref:Glycosyl hydrolases family 16 n=1 Tax=Friedmanniella luteola TaxID=546871 RepID=A0A1H1YER2_9ACTN|nr:glycoside hydrolase family 16 protein [Friedmanniella luteola]SDT19902.1 Glycosyl hydrolases family 16 [Friedmanniella luteola]